ncbi:MAG: LysM peptidoglycan-binding domain-containing protein [Ruminococcaceae bacterium]|nr:LysM peptidoglycan-binding domain-containing protein [Oscillospiraceae bacterium]
MNTAKKLISIMLVLLIILSTTVPAFAVGDIVIYFTNDIHTYIDNNVGEENENGLTYSKIAALKKNTPNSILVDAGDHIQGTAYGSMDKGATIIELMNSASYDVATLGNHEFDYGMDVCLSSVEHSMHKYVSCNFIHESNGIDGDTVLDAYTIIEAAGKKIAFIGITTPETFTSSTPAYFQDNDGNYIYDILGGSDGSELYEAVQTAIDNAKADGADYTIALGHLGVDPSSSPWTSKEVIANTSGLDAFIDGHSHTTIECEEITDKEGNTVILSQTGSYLNAVGQMTISSDGTITAQLLTGEKFANLSPDIETKAIEDRWIAEINESLGEVIGFTEITLDNFDTDGNRLVRKQSTNSGEFAADALYHLFDSMGIDVDAAVMNGGGTRNAAITGELSYLTCKEIHTFGNVACLISVTGQQLLDALEWGVSELQPDGSVEAGSFLHVSGLKFNVYLSIPSTVQMDEKGIWIGGPTGEYRVQDVQILNNKTGEFEPLDLEAKYNLAGYNYTLRNDGDGFAMLKSAENVLDYVAEDYMVLAQYIQSFPVDEATGLPTIGEDSQYADVYGQGRITIHTKPYSKTEHIEQTEHITKSENEEVPASSIYTVLPGDNLWKIAQMYYGSGTQWSIIYNANKADIKNPDLIFIGQTLIIPAA